MYWLKADFNPYYHNPQLAQPHHHRRAARPDGDAGGRVLSTSATSTTAASTAFTLTHSHSGAFSLVYRDVPPEVQAIWHAGQQRLTDRFLYGTVGGCTNQWTILLSGLWRY